MVEILTAWVLIVTPYSKEAISVSNIASESACEKLGEKMFPANWFKPEKKQRYLCFSYEVVK